MSLCSRNISYVHYLSNAIRKQTSVQVYWMRLQLHPVHKISEMSKMIATNFVNHHKRVDFPDKMSWCDFEA